MTDQQMKSFFSLWKIWYLISKFWGFAKKKKKTETKLQSIKLNGSLQKWNNKKD